MAHFAKIIDGVVVDVAVIDQEHIDTGLWGDPAIWVQTSYNTRAGVYYTPNTNTPDPDQSKAFRKNFAQPGYRWDADRDAFIPPQPYPSWTLDENSCTWRATTPHPNDGKFYDWNESARTWVQVTPDGTPVEVLP